MDKHRICKQPFKQGETTVALNWQIFLTLVHLLSVLLIHCFNLILCEMTLVHHVDKFAICQHFYAHWTVGDIFRADNTWPEECGQPNILVLIRQWQGSIRDDPFLFQQRQMRRLWRIGQLVSKAHGQHTINSKR